MNQNHHLHARMLDLTLSITPLRPHNPNTEGLAELKQLIQFLRNRTNNVSFDSQTDFILGFRVQRVIFVNGTARHKLYTKGTSTQGEDEEADELPKPKLEENLSLNDVKKACLTTDLTVEIRWTWSW